jgi:hypothetical protein
MGSSFPALENDGGYTCTNPLCFGRLDNIACATRMRSLAIDRGWPTPGSYLACPTTDQKGSYRNGACESGAYEFTFEAEIFIDGLKCSGIEEPPS